MAVENDPVAAEPPVDDLADLDQLGDDPALDNIDPSPADDSPASPAPEPAADPASPAASTAPATSAAPAVAPSAAATTTPSTSLRDKFAANGVRLAARDDEAAIAEVSTFIARDLPQLQQLAQIGQQVQPHMEEFRQWLAEKNGGQQARPSSQPRVNPAQPNNEWMPLPEFDPAWNGMVEYDEQGMPMRAKNGAALDLPQRIAAYNSARSKRGEEIVNNFPQLVQQFAAPLIQQQVAEQFNQLMAAREQSQFVADAISSNEDWMFDLDPITHQRQRDFYGNPVLTQDGINYQREIATLQQLGLTDKTLTPQAQHWLAMRLIGKLGGPTTAATPSTPVAQPTPVDPKNTRQQQLIDNQRTAATRNANRGGSATNERPGQLAPTQNESLNAGKLLKEVFAAAGVSDDGLEFDKFEE